MKSIYTRIDNLGKENRNTVFKIISKKILDDFSNGIFLSQEDLAFSCHCSKATITSFSKAALVSGYRELQIRLKIEFENNFILKVSNNTMNEKQVLFDEKNKILNKWIDEVGTSLCKFFKELKNNKIFIFSSYQTEYSTIFLEDVLLKNNIDNKFIKIERDILSITNIDINQNNFLFIFSGRDNNILKKVFEHVIKYTNNIAIIASLNWKDYLSGNKNNVYYFDNENFEKTFIDRNFELIHLWKYIDFLMN
ncbi:hypothetical protein [Spiroplasma diminutum]|uniref:HTH rpiR-type domain-containing protein n=1 Tax=Spiroplasma diminutum CUAS-1 TaxID=1276221 RepID=S5LWR1_9MOLU|nr:hypothetical protein [Spiroplasma diminutum]AGR42194.1 hypothetical protein SDIMI_v3c04900 [Spiroplasma diminutum CUAS-1]